MKLRKAILTSALAAGLTAGLSACVPVSAFAATPAPVQSARALREECSAHSQAGMRECLAKKAESSQKALRQAEEQVAAALGKWDEDAKYVTQSKTRLAASGKAFAAYRDAECGFASSLSGGGAGNATEIGRLACVAELNNRRAEQLRDAVSDLPLK